MPLPGVEVRIRNEQSGEPAKRGDIGMIQVRGPNVFSGYWRSPEKTKAEFSSDGFFITGDLGLMSQDGYVSIVGREKDLVISGGLNVYPAEVENEIDALPSIAESAVIGVPHPDFGEAVVAVVSARPGATVAEDDIRSGLAGVLAAFKVPKKICVLEQLPRNAMGKIQKNVLRDRFKGLFAPR
jgi:malonyl-CoA/methylmalonyl-CoA synthetase